jgi:hypothetical protein
MPAAGAKRKGKRRKAAPKRKPKRREEAQPIARSSRPLSRSRAPADADEDILMKGHGWTGDAFRGARA